MATRRVTTDKTNSQFVCEGIGTLSENGTRSENGTLSEKNCSGKTVDDANGVSSSKDYTNGVAKIQTNGSSSRDHANGANNDHVHGSTFRDHANGTNARINDTAPDNGDTESATIRRLRDVVHFSLIPLFLLVSIPNLVIVLWYTAAKCDGSFAKLCEEWYQHGFLTFLVKTWSGINILSPLSVSIILAYTVWALILMVLVPGREVDGPVTPKGNVPKYTDNGFSCYVITMVAFWVMTYFLKQLGYTPTIVYDHFDEFLASLTVLSHILCVSLGLKGLFSPSTSDSGSSGNLIFDYFWGMELYPRVRGVDIKVFTNCRFGLTVWALLVCIFALKNYEINGALVDSTWVSAALQLFYITKFFWWESGYMRTIDIMLDRAGYYICWGCLVYVPGVYSSVSLYLVEHPVRLGPGVSTAILVVGLSSCVLNYLADKQKLDVRRLDGDCLVWGRKAEVIRAKYQLENGETRESLLLVSGYWGISRHFHYIPELVLALAWCVPAAFDNLMAYTYFIHLFFLLIHRTYRDDDKCQRKYRRYWDEYRERVGYKIIPYIF